MIIKTKVRGGALSTTVGGVGSTGGGGTRGCG